MATVGGGWSKYEDDKQRINVNIDEALLPLTITKEKRLCLVSIPDDKRTSDKSPDYRFDIYIPKDKNE